MIRQIYEVTYKERFGYANTFEEAKQMEENFKSSFNGGQLSSINCDNEIINNNYDNIRNTGIR